MSRELVAEYDAKRDERGRLTLKGVSHDYYHVTVYEDERIELLPRMLVDPRISRRTLDMIDQAMDAIDRGEKTESVDPSALLKRKVSAKKR
jgi:hypothetical protein